MKGCNVAEVETVRLGSLDGIRASETCYNGASHFSIYTGREVVVE